MALWAAGEGKTVEQTKIFAVVETDARQKAAGRMLRRMGFGVAGAEETALADYILLPLPLDDERIGLARLLRAAKPGALALGGKVSEKAQAVADAAHIEMIDYFARPELATLNAIPTAEGCISLLLQNRKRTLWNSPVLVVGYGHIGSALAARLCALGAEVTVAARRAEQRALALASGCAEAADTSALARLTPQFDTVVNTAPARLLTAEVLAAMPAGSLIVDLASRPGGTDFAAARELGLTAIHALSLPAVCAPESAGEFVARTVLEILTERGELG
jgi:dipicolinate synthase subunit A